MPNKPTAADILEAAADLYKRRNTEYAESFRKIGPLMMALFPEGLTIRTSEDFIRFHFFLLILIKLTRYANNWTDGHSDSLCDAAVYCAMMEAFDREFFQ